MLEKINLIDITTKQDSYESIINKAGRVVDGVSHGRTVLKGDGVYYKIFDKEYCRRENFIKALEAGFFDEVAPALQSLIEDDGKIVGYTMEAGETLNEIPFHFYQRILSLAKEKKCSFTIWSR